MFNLFSFLKSFFSHSEPEQTTSASTLASSTPYSKTNDIPSTLILLATTHGCIMVNENETPKMFVVPNKMKIIKLTATPLGESNFSSDAKSKVTLEQLEQLKQQLITADTGEEYADAFNPIISSLKKYEERIENTNLNYADQYTKDYYYQKKQRGYKFNILLEGDNIYDKHFIRHTDDNITDVDFKINIVNIDGQPDLLDWIKNDNKEYENRDERDKIDEYFKDIKDDIYFSEIVNYLKTKGVYKIVFIDTTCEEYFDTSKKTHVDRRTKRKLRRRALNETPNKRRLVDTISEYSIRGGKKTRRCRCRCRRRHRRKKTMGLR